MGNAMGQTSHIACAVVGMIILGIDTATDAVSVALHDGDVVLASSEINLILSRIILSSQK